MHTESCGSKGITNCIEQHLFYATFDSRWVVYFYRLFKERRTGRITDAFLLTEHPCGVHARLYRAAIKERLRFVSSSENCPRDDGTNFHFLCAIIHHQMLPILHRFAFPILSIFLYPIYIYFFDLLATPFVKTLILHGTRLLNDQPIVQQLYYIVSRVVLASPLREEEEEEEVFSSSHVSLRQKPRFCSPPPPSPTVVGHVNHILPSSFHLLLRDLTIRLCTHARLRERQLTHAANHRVLSSPPRVSLFLFLDPLVAVCIERRRE